MDVFETIGLITRAVVADRPGDSGERFEILREIGCPAGGLAVPKDNNGEISLFGHAAGYLVVLADCGAVVRQSQIDDYAGLVEVMELGKQIRCETLTGGDQRADRSVMGCVRDGEDEKVVTDSVNQ